MEIGSQTLCIMSTMSSSFPGFFFYLSIIPYLACGFCPHICHLMVTKWRSTFMLTSMLHAKKKKKEIAKCRTAYIKQANATRTFSKLSLTFSFIEIVIWLLLTQSNTGKHGFLAGNITIQDNIGFL